MKYSLRMFSLFLVLTVVSGLFAPELSAAGDTVRLEMILVKAGDQGDGVDPALRPYAGTLQRLFRFKSYKQVKRQGMKLNVPGSSSASLKNGQSLVVTVSDKAAKGPLRADIEWKQGGRNLLRTKLQLRSGSPAVLGGPRNQDGTWLVILTLR